MSDLTERLRAGADIVAQRQKIPRALLFPLLREAADTIEAQARTIEEQKANVVYLDMLTGAWADGTPEPPPSIHVMGSPECVAGLKAKLAEGTEALDTIEKLTAERDEARLRLGMLVETVGDFHTAITCTDSDSVIPDMLAAMNDEQRFARAFLARIEGTTP